MVFRLRRFYLVLALLAVCIAFGGRQTLAQTNSARFFPETGHWVKDEFLIKYEATETPAIVYGAPITEYFDDPLTGYRVQYFEKARFELHPEAPDELRVQLTKLGEYLYQKGQPISTPTNTQACTTFVQTGYAVCYAFLDFFEAHGGVAQFGYPISGFEIHDGWIVQYFQNSRFEWHPENPPGERVTISNLGYRYFYEQHVDPTLLNPVPNDQAPNLPVTGLEVHAFAKFPVMPLNGTQTLYIIVRDQYHNPIEGVEVEFTVVLPDGSQNIYQADQTNHLGVSILSFDVNTTRPGTATILVKAIYENGVLVKNTRTSFAVWW